MVRDQTANSMIIDISARTEQMRVECAGRQRRGNPLGVCLTDSPSTFLPSGRPNKIVGPTGGHHQ